MTNLQQQSATKDPHLLLVLTLAFLAGMLVALSVYMAWTMRTVPPDQQGGFKIVALAVCPAFVLAGVLAPLADSTLAVVLTVGTIVFANAFLYAGVAAGIYFVVTLVARKKHSP